MVSAFGQHDRQRGFTLVELALVMLIIGLMAGVTMKAQQYMANARITTTIAQVQAYQKAMVTFHDRYIAIPGDFNAAQWCLKNCTGTNNCLNGNGDNAVGDEKLAWESIDATITSENTQFWRHLALAELADGITPAGTQTGWGLSAPASRLNGGFLVRQASVSAGLPDGVVLVMRAHPQGTWQGGTAGLAISPREAAMIDRKIDDGAAFSGYVYAVSHGSGAGCGTANTGTNGPLGYDETSNERTCDMMFKLWPAPPAP